MWSDPNHAQVTVSGCRSTRQNVNSSHVKSGLSSSRVRVSVGCGDRWLRIRMYTILGYWHFPRFANDELTVLGSSGIPLTDSQAAAVTVQLLVRM